MMEDSMRKRMSVYVYVCVCVYVYIYICMYVYILYMQFSISEYEEKWNHLQVETEKYLKRKKKNTWLCWGHESFANIWASQTTNNCVLENHIEISKPQGELRANSAGSWPLTETSLNSSWKPRRKLFLFCFIFFLISDHVEGSAWEAVGIIFY